MVRIAGECGMSRGLGTSRSRKVPLCGRVRDEDARARLDCMISPARRARRARPRHSHDVSPRPPARGLDAAPPTPTPPPKPPFQDPPHPLTTPCIGNTLQGSVYADVAQLAEQPPCKRQVEGSSPSVSFTTAALGASRWSPDGWALEHGWRAAGQGREQKLGGVPKRSNGADCKSAGSCLRRFESCPHHDIGCAGVAQLARASAFQAEGRGFESRLPLWVGLP
jgi:hypothetical protein